MVSTAKVLTVVIPAGFLLGAGMEFFMLNTGFYDVAIRKASERRSFAVQEQERRQKRMKELNISFDCISDSNSKKG